MRARREFPRRPRFRQQGRRAEAPQDPPGPAPPGLDRDAMFGRRCSLDGGAGRRWKVAVRSAPRRSKIATSAGEMGGMCRFAAAGVQIVEHPSIRRDRCPTSGTCSYQANTMPRMRKTAAVRTEPPGETRSSRFIASDCVGMAYRTTRGGGCNDRPASGTAWPHVTVCASARPTRHRICRCRRVSWWGLLCAGLAGVCGWGLLALGRLGAGVTKHGWWVVRRTSPVAVSGLRLGGGLLTAGRGRVRRSTAYSTGVSAVERARWPRGCCHRACGRGR